MVYDVCFDVASFLFLAIAVIVTFGRYSKPTRRNICFKRLLAALLITILVDITGGYFITNSHLLPVKINMLVQSVGFFGISVVVWSYVAYMECFIEDTERYKMLHIVNLCVGGIYVAVLIANIFGGFIFYFDENLLYRRGPLYLLVYFVPFYYFFYGVSIMLANRRKVEKKQLYATLSFIPLIIVGCLIQFFIMTSSLILLFTITLSVVIIFFCIETPDYNKLETALFEADSANRSKGDFLANMSHEIRTPMNAIVGMCELILREKDISETVREYCFNIQNSGRSLLAIINDILDFSKIESGKLELIEEEFNIATVLNDVINMVNARKGDKKLEIIVHVDPDIPMGLSGDEFRIRQVILNLVTNAIKYSNEGCVSIRVSQTRHDYGINLSVSVSDTGVGISEEDLEKLFSSFQQVDTKKNRAVEGTGLGLVISKQLVTSMGGFISVDSEYGVGSEFRFVIPLKVKNETPFISVKDAEKVRAAGYIEFGKFTDKRIAEEYRTLILELSAGLHTRLEMFETMAELKTALENAEEAYTLVFTAREEFAANEEFFRKTAEKTEVVLIQDRQGAIEVPQNVLCMFKPFYALSAASIFNHESVITNMSDRRNADIRFVAPKARVLVVDDNDVNLEVAVGLMRPYHMQVVTAKSAASAISLLGSKDFDLVFMDHMMPEVDGVEATRMIREKEEEYYQKVPIIALTANAVNGVKEMFLEAGMNDFVAKPIELTALDRVLRTWLPKELMITSEESEQYMADRRKRRTEKPESVEEAENFNVETGIFYAGGDEESYLKILERYVKKGEEKQEYIQKLFEEKDWKNYVIEVHALKSSSLAVGSKPLSERAKELELAGKAENYSLIEEKNAELLALYKEVLESGQKYLDEKLPKQETAAQKEEEIPLEDLEEIPLEKMAEFIEKIRIAYEAFDGEEMVKVCEETAAYSCNGTALGPLFREVAEAARDFEYDEAARIAAGILGKI